MLQELTVTPTLTWEEVFAGWLAEDGRKAGGKGKLGKLSIEGYLQDVRHLARWFEQSQGQAFEIGLLSRTLVREYFDCGFEGCAEESKSAAGKPAHPGAVCA